MKKLKLASLLACSVLFTGCASIMNDTVQPVKIETKTQEGKPIKGAECSWTNDFSSQMVKSGSTSMIRRSSKDLDIICKSPNLPDANGRLISRANAGLAGNIIFGGGIGAIIDHSKGTAYTYPSWIEMTFGETLVFDRNHEKEGQPLSGFSTVVR